jgi:predicted ATPase with chaperone activity
MRCTELPKPPKSLDAAGLDQAFIFDLVLKHLLLLGEFRMADVADRVKLPVSMVELVLEEHRKEKLIEVKGAANYSATSYVFKLTELGHRRAQQVMELCRYAGPAPVSLDDYRRMVQLQTVRNIMVGDEELKKALSHLVVNDAVRKRLGPAMISGQAVFIHGPSGNGKTAIAEAIGRAFPENVYIPYSVTVGGQIIRVFDQVSHVVVEPPVAAQGCDARWIMIRRPVVISGGELSLKMLDLNFDIITKCYDAPLQMKANNGLFILDDFGRQRAEPSSILNRWIVPLERRIDHLTLHTETKIVVPFDVLMIFSSDLDPKELVHEAFLRRLRYKIKVDRPTDEQYLEIFQAVCQKQGLEFSPQAYSYLLEQWYGTHQVTRNACHPRDLIELILTDSRYNLTSPRLTEDSVKAACTVYFGER